MRLFFIFCLFISSLAGAQSPATYTAVYTKTVETIFGRNPENVRVNVSDNPVVREMADQALAEMTGSPLTLQFRDSLTIFPDSTICFQIPCNVSSIGGAVRINVQPTQTVFKHDRYYQVTASGAGLHKQRAEAQLINTGAADKILGYDCEIYHSEDGKLKAWICRQLPSAINAGLPLVVTQGAVLKYELRDNGKKASATLLKILKNGR